MANTKLIMEQGSQAVLVPPEMAYSDGELELVIERQGDELRIRPARRRMSSALDKFAKFSPDFMALGRPHDDEGSREAL